MVMGFLNQNNESSSADQVKKNSAGFAAPLGCHPQWIKSTTAPA
jgi:hypothetical protein